MDSRFVKRIIKAVEDLDTLVYLSCDSFDIALKKWLNDFTRSLNEVVDTFEKFDLQVSASVSDFSSRKLEQTHKEFLDRVIQYIEGVDLAFARKALQYSKLAIKLNGPKTITAQVLKDIKDAEQYLNNFEMALKRVRNYSRKLMLESKSKKVNTLPKYKSQFDRLSLFERLTLDLAISLLKKNSEI